MNGILILSLLAAFTQSEWSNAAVANRTEQHYVRPVVESFENVRAARQQSTNTSTGGSSSSLNPATGAAITGLLATIFNGINPLVNNVIFGLQQPPPQLPPPNRRAEAEQSHQLTQLPTTARPSNVQIVIKYDEDNSTVVGAAPPPPRTTTPIPFTQQANTTPFPPFFLQGLAPFIQNVLFGPPPQWSEAEQVIAATQSQPTAPPSRIKIIFKYDGANPFNSTVESTTPSPPTTTTPAPTPTPTTEQPETASPFSSLVLRYRVRPKNRTTTTTPTPTTISPRPQLPQYITRRTPQGQILVFLRQPNDNQEHSPQNSHSFPDSSKVNAHLPDSPNSDIKNFESINYHLPDSSMAEIMTIIENRYNQLLKVVEEDEIVPLPVQTSTTEKQNIHVVLPLSEYEEFLKYLSKTRISYQTPPPRSK